MPIAWFWISAAAFVCVILVFLVSGFVFAKILGQILPMLDETRHQVQDLGDITVTTLGHASETMDIVENRVSKTMGQAAVSGKAAANQALGVGTAITGIYMVTRLVATVRKMWKPGAASSGKKRRVR